MTPHSRKHDLNRQGLTLLEVVLALAIAAIAMSLLAELVRIGNRSAARARDITKAQLIANSVMAEYVSGVQPHPPQGGSGQWEVDTTWSYAVDVQQQSQINPEGAMYMMTVSVTHDVGDVTSANASKPTYSLTQWLYIPPEPEEEVTEDEAADTSTADAGAGA